MHLMTQFNSTNNGFRFINRFELPIFERVRGMMWLGNLKTDLVYGLCGGMCSAALDLYYAKRGLPTVDQIDKIDLGLFFYLWERQLDTLDADVLARLFKWMAWSDRTLALKVAREEWPKVKTKLAGGNPVILALVRVHLSNPTNNHQVLAIGYEEDPTGTQVMLFLYDPNHPGETPCITMDLSKPGTGINIHQSTGEALRGFFVIDYEPKEPPVFE
jgi:hypothetical protein